MVRVVVRETIMVTLPKIRTLTHNPNPLNQTVEYCRCLEQALTKVGPIRYQPLTSAGCSPRHQSVAARACCTLGDDRARVTVRGACWNHTQQPSCESYKLTKHDMFAHENHNTSIGSFKLYSYRSATLVDMCRKIGTVRVG